MVSSRVSEVISGSSKGAHYPLPFFPLSPTLFGLYIDKLEEWLNLEGGDGVLMGEYVIRLLLYADDLILIAKSALVLQEHLISL